MTTANASSIRMQGADRSWQGLYRVGAVAAILIVLISITDIILSSTQGPAVAPATLDAAGWFARFQDNWFLRLCDLGFWNMLTSALMIPVVLSLFGAHRQAYQAWAALGATVYLVGIAIYVANNAALPLFVLSTKYATAATDAQRTLLAAAGEALLARGEDFTFGSLVGFLFTETAGLILSVTMLRSRVLGRAVGWAGPIGFSMLLLFTLWATFTSSMGTAALVFAMIGGLASAVWYVLIARGLWRMGAGG